MRVEDKIPFYSPEGQALLRDTSSRQTLLIRLFRKQENDTFCGIHSSALLMSARHLGEKYPVPSQQTECAVDDVPYVEGNMFSFEETKSVLDEATVNAHGATLQQVHDLLRAHGLDVKKIHVNESSVEEFRSLASAALAQVDSSKGIILNYDEYDLGQDEFVHGHFSPLAAYHAKTDRFLLLDTWFNTTDVWVKTEDLFTCMNTFDKDAAMHRGFLLME